MTVTPRTSSTDLQPYRAGGYELIPLHLWNARDSRNRERGKSPRDAGWRTAIYTRKQVVDHMEGQRGNVGIRLRATDLVIDVDPRRFPEGSNPLSDLCEAVGLDQDECPTLKTGSDGRHLYLTKPADIVLVDSLPGFPGIEFKSLGRQVVAAGSIHPNGRMYEWDDFRPQLDEPGRPPSAPKRLLLLATRPKLVSAGGGEVSAELIAKTLSQLEATDYSEHDRWLELMMACHHGSGGEARQEFIDWSTQDPQYADQAWEIGRRWDSLSVGKEGKQGVTVRTLFKRVLDAGGDIPHEDPGHDFPPLTEEEIAEIRDLGKDTKGFDFNAKYAIVQEGGKFRVITEVVDPTLNRSKVVRMARRDFEDINAHLKIERGDTLVPAAKAWIESPKARRYDGIVFDPEQDHPGLLNLWKGWGVEPQAGDWSLMRQLIEEVLCSNDTDSVTYVLNWIAYMFQHPSSHAEVALVFRGEKGTGKGTLGRALNDIAGSHGFHISSPSHFIGRFNAHLRDCLYLFADEAFWAGSKEGESVLKQLITEKMIAYEGKGVSIEQGPNRIHIVMASNSDWVIPAGSKDERRFAVFDVSNAWQGDREKFNALNEQMQNGGLGAMLYDLKLRELDDWHPRNNVPNTGALKNQKLLTLDMLQQWWQERLASGNIPGMLGNEDWNEFSALIALESLHDSYLDFCLRHGQKGKSVIARQAFSMRFRKINTPAEARQMRPPENSPLDIEVDPQGRAYFYRLQPLFKCREEFAETLGIDMDWGNSDAG